MALKDLKKGTHSIYGEKLDWTLYDAATLISTTTEYKFFQNAEGQGTPVKTQDQTNSTSGGQIPTGQRLTISRIKLMYHALGSSALAANVAFWHAFLASSVFRFIIPGKDSILTVTLQELLGAATLFPIAPLATFNLPLMQPYYHGIFPLNKKIILAEQTQFHCEVKCYQGTPNAGLNTDVLRIGLNGILERRS
jgi:hypothetical protein